MCWYNAEESAVGGRKASSESTIYNKRIIDNEHFQQGLINSGCRLSWNPRFSLLHLVQLCAV